MGGPGRLTCHAAWTVCLKGGICGYQRGPEVGCSSLAFVPTYSAEVPLPVKLQLAGCRAGDSLTCNLNVACEPGWDLQANAVVLLAAFDANEGYFCTGKQVAPTVLGCFLFTGPLPTNVKVAVAGTRATDAAGTWNRGRQLGTIFMAGSLWPSKQGVYAVVCSSSVAPARGYQFR